MDDRRATQIERIYAAENALRQGNTKDALELFKGAIEALPGSELAAMIRPRLAVLEAQVGAVPEPDYRAQIEELKSQGKTDEVNNILRELVSLQPGTESAMRGLFEGEDMGRVLSTIRGEDARNNLERIPFARFRTQKPPDVEKTRIEQGDTAMERGDFWKAHSEYTAAANDAKAPPHIRQAAAELAKQAAERINKT